MELLLLGLAFAFLLAFNAFYVLAEFAIVKVRPTRVAELEAAGDKRAVVLRSMQAQLDQYLSVCQVGITLASVALGIVGTKATDVILGGGDHGAARYIVGIAISYVVVSGSHIVLGEQVPKFAAIRVADKMALWCTTPLRVSHFVFYPALFLLSGATNGVLRLLGLGRPTSEEHHTEGELRLILDQSQELGLMSFRRLLFMENVFDFGALTAKDAMRPKAAVKCLDARAPWAENFKAIQAARLTRYPLIESDGVRPTRLVHLKDLVLHGDPGSASLAAVARPMLSIKETTTLEAVIAEMQRKRIHAAVVSSLLDEWTGFITLEDVIEELVGTIRDEFEDEEPARLADALTLSSIHLGVESDSPIAALKTAMAKMPAEALPLPREQIVTAVAARERQVPTYLGQGIAMPHARIPGLAKPFLLFLRSDQGLKCEGTAEKAHLVFMLLTPAGQPRVHQRLQSVIATMLHESEYVKERLQTATSAAEVLEVVRTGEQAVLD
ncbi:MAG TPA: CNNM domain-containing protein [Myxococcales bacterium]